MDDMKEALDKAASSADQAVRHMALRYREMQQEFSQYESFFAVYKQGVGVNGSATATRAPAAKTRAVTSRTSTPRADRADDFSNAMQAILTEHGQPMKLSDLHTAYQERSPDDQTSIETFRQRLVKRRGTVILVPQRGYWWAEAPLNTVEPNG